jgi:ADP-ribose pyrophosphatase YjhB (NUDIX family)
MNEPKWLVWGRALQALAQTGLAYTKDPFDRDRFAALQTIAAEIMAAPAGMEPPAVEAIFAAEQGYATPKVGVRAAVFRGDGAILMVREMTDGRWALPGGWADINQSPRESVVREVREETGFEVVPRKLAAVFDRSESPAPPSWPFHIWRLFFVCDILGGAPRTSYETTEVRFFAESELPGDADLSPNRSNRRHIDRMFAHYRAPHLPTEFE